MAQFQGARHDPYQGFKFHVVIDGLTAAGELYKGIVQVRKGLIDAR
jgi:hypothetical protein